jgi:hypothetical protein
MKPELTTLRWLAAGTLSLCVVSAFADARDPIRLAQNAPPAAMPATIDMRDSAPGDHWTYEVEDEISGTIKETRKTMVTDVTKDEVAVHVDFVNSGRSSNIVFDRLWNVLRENGYKFSPNDGSGVQSPLTVNAQWKISTNALSTADGSAWKRTGNSRVTGQEHVTTKAGQFDTFVIDTKTTSRNVKDPTRASDSVVRTWFSPDVNHWVKRNFKTIQDGHVFRNDTLVLVDYGRRKQQ